MLIVDVIIITIIIVIMFIITIEVIIDLQGGLTLKMTGFLRKFFLWLYFAEIFRTQ